jgi:hypothetical protein
MKMTGKALLITVVLGILVAAALVAALKIADVGRISKTSDQGESAAVLEPSGPGEQFIDFDQVAQQVWEILEPASEEIASEAELRERLREVILQLQAKEVLPEQLDEEQLIEMLVQWLKEMGKLRELF